MCALVTGVQTCALPICGLVGIAGFTAGQVGPDATLVQHARELRGLGRTPASTHADYADLRNWSLFEPQFGLCGQPLVHLFEAVVNEGPFLIRTRKHVGASTVRFDARCMNPDVRFLSHGILLRSAPKTCN